MAFTHLGFPSYFRIALSIAKFVAIALLLFPVPPRLKEWAYCGFFIDLTSAVIAHVAAGDPVQAWIWAAGSALLGALSHFFWRRPQATAVARTRAPMSSSPRVSFRAATSS